MDDELIDAAWDKNIQRIRDLLTRGANPNIHEVNDSFPDVKGDTPLMISSMMKGNFNIVKLLLDKGADPNIGNYGSTALVYAIQRRNDNIVRLLLDRGADPNLRAHKKWRTALMVASRKGNIEIVKILLEHGADINISDSSGDTALIIASENGHTEIVKLLLDRGADPETVGWRGWTALTIASNYGFTEIVQLIQDHIALRRSQQNLAFMKYFMDYDDLDQDVASRLFEIPRDYDPKINIRMLDEARRDRLTKSRQRLASMRSMHSREGSFGTVRYDPSIMENISRHLSRIGPIPSVQERLILEDRQTGSGRRRRIKQRKQRKKYTTNRF